LRAISALFLFASLGLSQSQSPAPSWLDIPFVQQVKAGCGSAAVAMIIEYWARQFPGLDKAQSDAERIDQLLPPTSPKGIQGDALKQYLNGRGFQAYIFDGEPSDLQNHLAKGRPVIVCLAPKGNRGLLHYAVVAGLDEKDVWLNDPARGKLFHEDLERFRTEWRRTGNWALLAVPRPGQ
jgi:predicted double-glycine peptidase